MTNRPSWRILLFELLCAPAWLYIDLVGLAFGVAISRERQPPAKWK